MEPKKRSRISLLSALAVGAIVTLAVSGCTAAQTPYNDLAAVMVAFTEAGGECLDTTEMNSMNAGFGIHGLNCASGDAVLWFEDAEAKTQWLSLLEGTGETYVEGSNWIVMTADTETVAGPMGGSAKG